MLNSVIYIYFLIGFILPLGLTFLRPSAATTSPIFNPDKISTFPFFLIPILTSVLSAIFSFEILYTYDFSLHNLTTFRFRLWLPSAPVPPPEALTAFSSSAFSPSRRSFLPPPVPLLHYFCRLCARTTLPPLRLG